MPVHRTTLPKTSLRAASAVLIPLLILAGLVRVAADPATAAPETTYQQNIRPLLKQYCEGCHGGAKPVAGVDLTSYATVPAVQKDQTTWRKVLTQLLERSMPPHGATQPSLQQRDQLAGWLAQTLDSADPSLLPKTPGRVLIHRLSRTEYNNTLRDLFGVDSRPADKFPADGGGGAGFDNNADTLFVPPILMERYLQAAGEVLAEAPPKRILVAVPGKGLPARAAARRILAHFAALGYRRPVQPAEVGGLLRLYDSAAHRGEKFPDAVRFALKAILVSPEFLFRVERDRPTSQPYPVSDFELASRLSYFLWASMPDAALFRLARQGRLHDPKVLDQQVSRMIRDPKAASFADSFAGQWLRIRELYATAQPDPGKYPEYTPALRDAMYHETVDFFASILRENRSLLDLLDARYTYLNQDLAKLYGIPGVTGSEMRRVNLADDRRGGILGMASVLTITAHARRTSPVLRGKWVLEQVLGEEVPPPPPDAGGLPASDAPKDGMTFRQRLELHRKKPQCASCHSRMDPVGFGLENFDGIGRWRTEIGGQPIDSAGVLATGEKFSGPVELRRLILTRKDEFLHNLTEKMLAYALGRGLEPYDIPAVRKIEAAVKKDGYRSDTLLRAVVESYPFRYRKNTP